MAEKFNIENCRVAFAEDLWEAKAINGGKPRYSGVFLIAPTHPAVAKLRAVIQKVANDKWGTKAAAVMKALEAQDRVCLHDGNLKEYAGYAGNLYVSAARRPEEGRPRIVDRMGNDISRDSGILYSGCRVIALLEIWALDNPQKPEYGKRICATVRGVQFFADDARFSGSGTATDDEFQKLDADGASDDLMA
jgi:hypothetical protein